MGRRTFPRGDIPAYVIAQVTGAIVAAAALLAIASDRPEFVLTGSGLAVNGFGALSPGGYGMVAAALAEIALTLGFLFVILGSTDRRALAGFASIAIGLALTRIHLVSIPVSNTSVNPARSTGPALFVGGLALQQIWFFWIMPIVGALAGGAIYRWLAVEPEAKPKVTGGPI